MDGKAQPTAVSMYPSDREAVLEIRRALKLSSFSAAVQVAIRQLAEQVRKDGEEAAA